ncbi:MAG: hypothetical protein N2643_01305 [Endomicrobia bacterium]|nr:hypothetical protein [Endomicrobiia bacterium]
MLNRKNFLIVFLISTNIMLCTANNNDLNQENISHFEELKETEQIYLGEKGLNIEEENSHIDRYYNKLIKYLRTRVSYDGYDYYLYNRLKVENENLNTGFIFLRKYNEIKLDMSNIGIFLRKIWFEKKKFFGIDKIIFGNYRCDFGLGLAFSKYSYLPYLSRDVHFKIPNSIEIDNTTYDNANFLGVGIEENYKYINFNLFSSYKKIFANVEDLKINDNLIFVRNKYVIFKDPFDVSSYTLEKLIGYNISLEIPIIKIITGSCGYIAAFDKEFISSENEGYWRYSFRGNNLLLTSFYFNAKIDKINMFAEIAKSFNYKDLNYENNISGFGVNFGIFYSLKNNRHYLVYTYLEPQFYSPFGAPTKIYNFPNSQRGVKITNIFALDDKLEFENSIGCCKILVGLWQGRENSQLPFYPSDYVENLIKLRYRINKITFNVKNYSNYTEKYINFSNFVLDDSFIQTKTFLISTLYSVKYEIIKSLFLEMNFLQKQLDYFEMDSKFNGERLSVKINLKLKKLEFSVNYRILDKDKNMNFLDLEPYWRNVYILRFQDVDVKEKVFFISQYKHNDYFIGWLLLTKETDYKNQKDNHTLNFQLDIKL